MLSLCRPPKVETKTSNDWWQMKIRQQSVDDFESASRRNRRQSAERLPEITVPLSAFQRPRRRRADGDVMRWSSDFAPVQNVRSGLKFRIFPLPDA